MKALKVENGAVYNEFDYATAAQWCTPSVLGCSACIGASAQGGIVTLTITFNTPFGNWTKSFQFDTNTSFTWQPIPRVKLVIAIANLTEANNTVSFDLSGQICVDVPFIGWKCVGLSHHFDIPLPFAADALQASKLDDNQFAALLALHASGAMNSCNCNH